MKEQFGKYMTALAMSCLCSAALADDPESRSPQAHDRLLYQGPSTHSPVIMRLGPDTEPHILLCKRIEAKEWCKVNLDGRYGWVRSTEAEHAAPASTELRLHQGPSLHSPTIGAVEIDDGVTELLCKWIEGAEWCKVVVNGRYGWIVK